VYILLSYHVLCICAWCFIDRDIFEDEEEDGESFRNPNKPKSDWREEYLRARSMEIYVRPVLSLFAGLTFSQAAFIVNRAFDGGVALLGVEERLNAFDDYHESQDDVNEPHVKEHTH
jgi:hypothetical protein